MLKVPTPFPQVGSYALLIDKNLPAAQQRAELVRIMGYRLARRVGPDGGAGSGQASVAFPLRVGAFGNRIVAEDELIDATPLSADESREHADLQRHLRGRDGDKVTASLKRKLLRAEELRRRAIFALLMESELAKLHSLEAKAQPSVGRALPRDADLNVDRPGNSRQAA